MRFTVTTAPSKTGFALAACLALFAVFASGEKAAAGDNVFITQAKGGSYRGLSYTPPTSPKIQTPTNFYVPHSGSTSVTPETAAMTGGNIATTLEIGQYNRVFQGQVGSGNVSNVGIINGVKNNVGVLQAGHSLRSNLLLLNTQGMSVGVIQPNGSAPVNMLIARLPNGGLLIKR